MDTNNRRINHIGIILDGNRRFAAQKGMLKFKGHEAGAEKVEKLLEWTEELKIKELTLYTLSTENLNRESKELEYLFNIFKKWFSKFEKDNRIKEKGIKIKFIGDLSLIPKDIAELARKMENNSKDNKNYTINFCFAYGGRLELVSAFNKLKNKEGPITEADITNALWLSSEPDFIIRTGNKSRTSNFLPWQSVYSEWFFLEKMWPEFEKEDLVECMRKFDAVQRNFGK